MSTYFISTEKLTIEKIELLLRENQKIQLSEESKEKVEKSRSFLDSLLTNKTESIYGVNTGFGSLYNTRIPDNQLEQLQENLVLSHACGVGEEVREEIARLMLLLKIQGLSYGYSAIRKETIERLLFFYNNTIFPIIYEQGSLGASGDLSPLAHLALPLIGKGNVNVNSQKISISEVLRKYNLSPLKLAPKEGLALLNGTQFMSAYATYCLIKVNKLLQWSDAVAAIALDAFDARIEPFLPFSHSVRPHKGQIETAKKIYDLLQGSEIIMQHKEHLQDPYSFRCIPQVHGATKDVVNYVKTVIETEINSVTDNPLTFAEENKIVPSGNFHGQPLALSLDFLAIAMAEIASISERRIYKLISGQRKLPSFLTPQLGINSGLMIAQYTAASIVSQNKQLCTPASVDTIDSSNGQEDHVSMGANAATKALKVIENVEKVLAIELLVATQALEFRKPLKTSPILETIISDYRKVVSFIDKDRFLHEDIQLSIRFVQNYNLKTGS